MWFTTCTSAKEGALIKSVVGLQRGAALRGRCGITALLWLRRHSPQQFVHVITPEVRETGLKILSHLCFPSSHIWVWWAICPCSKKFSFSWTNMPPFCLNICKLSHWHNRTPWPLQLELNLYRFFHAPCTAPAPHPCFMKCRSERTLAAGLLLSIHNVLSTHTHTHM